jgi:ATP-dependent Clp protease ATP-binding subunit ClpA
LRRVAFCRREGVSLFNLQRWLGKQNRSGEARFVEDEARATAEQGRYRMGFEGGTWLEVEGGFDEREVRMLASIVREAARSIPVEERKTGLTLEFNRYLFGSDNVFRFDMSEFLHLDSVKLFMGDETGRAGRLGNVLAHNERGVLLFDEIEKAHRLIWDLFLQMLDAARITHADHRTYDLSGFYIVCTSNIGSDRLLRPSRLPFTTLERAVISELHRFFRPELIGRFDEKIVFKPLSQDTQREIGCLAISEELDRFKERGFNLTVSEAAFEFLVRRGIQKTLGAGP